MFQSARLKLTAWYLLIIMLVSAAFSLIIYEVLMSEVRRFDLAQRSRYGYRISTSFPASQELVAETSRRIIFMLAWINGGILFLSGWLGYILAGRTLEPIQEMVTEQNRFIGDASHELRTPLTSLKTAFEVYLRQPHPTLEESKSLVGESLEDVNKLQTLSDSLLRLAQYKKPLNHSQMEKLSLSKVVSDAVRRLQPQADAKKIDFDLTLSDVVLTASKSGLTELFTILIDNAIKYSAESSKIHIKVKKVTPHAVVSIADQGIGISPQDLPHIFDRFYRADSARSKSGVGGYGLGLSIARQIVTAHSGSIHAKSTPNKGTTFTLRFPLEVKQVLGLQVREDSHS